MFSTLSTELVLLIFDDLQPASLLAVSQTSRHFHYLALPEYLSRYGISVTDVLNSGHLLLESEATYALSGLQTWTTLTSLDHLSCKFGVGHQTHFFWEVDQLSRFVSRMRRVNMVTFHLGNIDSRWADGLAVVTSESWKPEFVHLLTTIIERGCSTLSLTQGHFVNSIEALAFVLQRRKGLFRRSVSSVANSWGASPLGAKFDPQPTLHNVGSNQLRSVSIRSDLVFTDPFYTWFIQKMNNSPIHSLSLRLSGIPQYIWSMVLSQLVLPSLSDLTIEVIDVTFLDLFEFLSRHPFISTLSLHPTFLHASTARLAKRAKKITLPRLASLSGSLGNVRELLDALQRPFMLQSVGLCLAVHQRAFRPTDFETLNEKIQAAMWGTLPTELSLKFLVPSFTEPTVPLRKSRGKVERTGIPTPFLDIHTVNLATDGQFGFDKWLLPTLPTWLMGFPALRHVSFSIDCVPPEPVGRVTLVEVIGRMCVGVELVTIGDDNYQLHLEP